MDVVKKFQRNEKPRILFSLTKGQRQSLSRMFYQGETIGNAKLGEILALLSKIRGLEGWLQCDCRQEDKPLLTVKRIRENGTLFLSRLNTRASHATDCVFSRLNSPLDHGSESRIAGYLNKKIFHLHKKNRTVAMVQEKPQDYCGGGGDVQFPRLGRVLYTLLERSGLNIITTQLRDINDQYRRLHEAADDFYLEPGIRASQYFWTHPGQIGYAGLSLHASRAPWPLDSRRHGIFILVADKIQKNTNEVLCKIKNRTHKLSFAGVVKKLSGRFGEVSAPYLVIFTITDEAKPGYYEPVNAFIIPVYSRSLLVPVDSSYERKVLRQLIAALPRWRKMGIQVKIKKPLFDTPVCTQEEKKYIRPDFLLSGNGQRIILEVGGSHETEYLERKKRTHRLMQEVGQLINFDAYEVDQNNNWQARLQHLIETITSIFDREVVQ